MQAESTSCGTRQYGSVSQRTVMKAGALYFLYRDAVSDTARNRTATSDRFSSDGLAVGANSGTFALALGHDNEGVT